MITQSAFLPIKVLSDTQKREIYDKYGEEGLKAGGGGGGGGGGHGHRSPEDIFAEVSISWV